MLTKNKKVLIFSIAYDPFIGGAEIALKEITNRINDIEWQMVTCSFGKPLPKKEKIGNIIVNRINCPKILFPFLAVKEAIKINKYEKFDIVWAMMTYAGFAGLFFKLLNKRIKFLLTLQEGTPISSIKRKSFFVYPLFCLMFKKTDKIQAISNFLASFGRDMGHKKEIAVIPNGVDVDIFSKTFSTEEKQEMKKVLNKKEEDIFLVTSSRLTYKNAVDDIIKSLNYLPKNISLIIIGKGEQGFALQKQVKCFGLDDRVKFLGFVKQIDLPKYFSVCDIFVRPSRSEGFGNSFIEAMASRLPVVATPVGGIVDFIDDRETGVFCSPDNPKSLAESISDLVENQSLRENIINNAYERVLKKYNWSMIAQQMKEQIFNKL